MTATNQKWAVCVRCRGVRACHTDVEKLHFWRHLLEQLGNEALRDYLEPLGMEALHDYLRAQYRHGGSGW
jgi:ABC-type transport system involved in cytochrome c biogenesis ATPase subunit